MLVVFAGGGTGGHLYPGIAVARALARLAPDVEFEFWGSGRPLEKEICRKEAITCRVLSAAPMPRDVAAILRFAKSLLTGYFEAKRLIKSRGVSVVVGLGGYSSFTPVYAATRLDLPTLVLEQNAVAGKANDFLSTRVSLVCLTWQASLKHMPGGANCVVTGNPLRQPIIDAAKAFSYDPSRGILILGGSTGAMGLNSMVIEALPKLAALGRAITHQTGSQDFERVSAAYKAAGVQADVRPFIDDMPEAYGRAALVIARAGGTTLSELALFGLPSILVPYPHHKDYHQMANARVFAESYAAEIIEEGVGAGEGLAIMAKNLLSDAALLNTIHAAALVLGKPDAAEEIASRILSFADKD
jgi:UDP-N-acetylglucosamine--N-acetylmuramyl-(pentapeptide) pyrophosphoryl-undecaprenol N-acetylglucosamine transferase